MAKFDPPGFPMNAIKKMKGKQVLVAFKTEQYHSGPDASIRIGLVVEVAGKFHIQGASYQDQPLSKFQRWWPMPEVQFTASEQKADKRRKQ